MKQHITKEQWDELNDTQKDEYLSVLKKIYGRENTPSVSVYLPDIGRLIEFLGYAWWEKLFKIEQLTNSSFIDTKYGKQELCDVLWQAVKFKLNELSNRR